MFSEVSVRLSTGRRELGTSCPGRSCPGSVSRGDTLSKWPYPSPLWLGLVLGREGRGSGREGRRWVPPVQVLSGQVLSLGARKEEGVGYPNQVTLLVQHDKGRGKRGRCCLVMLMRGSLVLRTFKKNLPLIWGPVTFSWYWNIQSYSALQKGIWSWIQNITIQILKWLKYVPLHCQGHQDTEVFQPHCGCSFHLVVLANRTKHPTK